jgi:acyl carrier protein
MLTGQVTHVNYCRFGNDLWCWPGFPGAILGRGRMAETLVFDKLASILRDVFDSADLVATPDLTAQKVMGWDSLGNVRLFLEIERVFSIRFSAMETMSLKNVGELAAVIEKKSHR